MVSTELSGPILVAAAVLGAVWIYCDTRCRAMDTTDIWTVGFFTTSVLLPVLDGLVALVFYLRS